MARSAKASTYAQQHRGATSRTLELLKEMLGRWASQNDNEPLKAVASQALATQFGNH